MKPTTTLLALALAGTAFATDYHVAVTGNDTNDGSPAKPLQTISAAANMAMPGDTVTVHAGVYRERIDPPRGGESDARRITYQAAAGETVVITGSEPAKGWEKVAGDTWKLILPSSGFGHFNPYVDRIRGDWFNPEGRVHHTGCVYLNGEWMTEARDLEEVMRPVGATPLWFATVDGDEGRYLANLAWFKLSGGRQVPAGEPSFRYGTKPAPCSEGGTCTGYIMNGDWLRFDDIEMGENCDWMEFRAAASQGESLIEVRLGSPEGELLGTARVTATGDWQQWRTFRVPIKPTSGRQSLSLQFKSAALDTGNTVIHAQFPNGVTPNDEHVEINKRQTVFYPSRNFINYITLRGFTLENAATNWAPPSSEQMALIGTNWSKGWVIENNTIRYSKCSGVSLGKYGDGTDNTNDTGVADPYTACVKRALAHGWNKATVGGHVVRNNHISHCEQAGIVGSLGCAFSLIEGNHIHHIYVRSLFSGAEMAGIKFHGAVDTVIRGNYIHHNNRVSGLWLDWMTQGTRVSANLMHDNRESDIFSEVNHGPYLVDNNILLSGKVFHQSHGGAFVHNLFGGDVQVLVKDGRHTPFLKPHSTEFMGVQPLPDGDDRFFNNLFAAGNGLSDYDRLGPGSIATGGNLYLKQSKPWKHEDKSTRLSDDPGITLEHTDEGVFLSMTMPSLPADHVSEPVDSERLGKTQLTNLGFTNPDGSPLKVDIDYFGKVRAAGTPTPGPFDAPGGRVRLKVWPKNP